MVQVLATVLLLVQGLAFKIRNISGHVVEKMLYSSLFCFFKIFAVYTHISSCYQVIIECVLLAPRIVNKWPPAATVQSSVCFVQEEQIGMRLPVRLPVCSLSLGKKN